MARLLLHERQMTALRRKAISLYSGGLDSLLATKMILDQGIEVIGVTFVTPFCNYPLENGSMAARASAARLGMELRVINHTSDLMAAITSPRHGFGRGLNPCVDCRIAALKTAAQLMDKEGASFLVTGEVVGQRPMSQRKQCLAVIDRETGLRGRILRPLSARRLPPTLAEQEGIVDRSRLGAIVGRSRHEQRRLARELGIELYPDPAGGCILTDPGFAGRLRRLLAECPGPTARQVNLLRAGRLFVSSDDQGIIVPRDDLENRRLHNSRQPLQALVEAVDYPGPLGGILSPLRPTQTTVQQAAALVARYGQGRDRASNRIRVHDPEGSWELSLWASPREGSRLAEELQRL